MKKLLHAELYKLWREGKTWYALAAVGVIESLILITAYYQGAAILELLLDNLRQSFYFNGNLLNGNLLIYIVLNSLWFNLPLILMIVTSSLITDEYKNGTLQTLMLQSVKKWQLITAKYITAFIYTLFVLAILMITTFILAYGIFGNGDLVVYLNTLNFFPAQEAIQRICFAFASGLLSMSFFTTVSVTLGILFKDPAKTWIASALFLVLCSLLLKIDLGLGNYEGLFFPKLTNTWQHFFDYTLNIKRIIINNILLLCYILIAAGAGIFLFNRKDIG